MHILYRKQNYRNIRLCADTRNETVGVLMRTGKITQVRWLGFIQAAEAKALPMAHPVKLVISRLDGEDLQPGEYVQGCLVGHGVWAVVDSRVRLVGRTPTVSAD